MKFIKINDKGTVAYSTKALAQGKNKKLKTRYKGLNLVCERPFYFYLLKKFEVSLLSQPFDSDGKIIYGKDIEIYFDQKGRWWCPEELSSEYLTLFFIKNPLKYLEIMSRKLQDTKRVIKTLKQINKKIDSLNNKDLVDNLNKLKCCYYLFYSYYSSTLIVYDELVLRFRQLLKKFLPVKEANLYFCEFLQSEMTKEAIKRNIVGEFAMKSKIPTTVKDRPNIFYKEPKFFCTSKLDNTVLEKINTSNLTKEEVKEFFALRLITPLAIQISEEAQYIECKMLWPIAILLLENINKHLIDENKIKSTEDIKDYSISELISMLNQKQERIKKRLVAKGLGVSKGKVQGKIKIIKDASDHSEFKENNILVTRLTDPSMVVLMGKAAGIICDIGSLTSHPSIVSREMGIPCIVSARCVKTGKNATGVLKDGMFVHMCGESGEVHLIK